MSKGIKRVIQKYQNVPDFIGIEIESINTKNFANDKLLHVACVNGDLLSVRELLVEGANFDDKGENGFTPLHYAVEHGHKELVVMLLKEGVDKTIKNDFDQTPQELAGALNELEIYQLLSESRGRVLPFAFPF